MKLKKEDVKEGDWFVFSKCKYLSPLGGADAMQVVKCFDDYMVVNSADGFIEKPYDHFRHFVDDALFVEDSCLIDDYYSAPYFEDHRTKLEVKHVLPYLPYELIVEIDGRDGMFMNDINYCGDIYHGQYDISEYNTGGLSNHYPDMVAYEWLFKNHFDVYGLIDKGLAIDKTELK